MTTDGVERPVDCIILGTGFVVDPRIYMQDFPVTGMPGHELARDWQAGAEAYYGISVTGYPNLHQLVGPNTALGHNSIIFMIEAQVQYVLDCMRALRERGADYLDVQPAAQAQFNERIQQDACRTPSGAPGAAAGTSRPTAAISRSGRTRPGATGSRRARSMPPGIGSAGRRKARPPVHVD